MRKIIFAVFIITLFAVSYSLSASDMEKYVFDNFHFLKEDEKLSAEFLIKHSKIKYWVLSIKSNDEIICLLAFQDIKNSQLLKTKEVNRKLFYLAYVLIKFKQLEEKFLQQRSWFFTLTNANAFKNLAQLLENEKISLQIVKEEISTDNINNLFDELDTLANIANNISTIIENSISIKNKIYNEPNTNLTSEFESYFYMQNEGNLYNLLQQFQQKATDYVTLRVALAKKDIANADLEPSTKQQLMQILDAPFSLATINQYVNILLANKQSLDQLFSLLHSAKSPIEIFLSELETRVERHYAYKTLYGEHSKLKKITNNRISTLQQASNEILATNIRNLWKDQKSLLLFETKFKKAKSAFENENYKLAKELANDALNNAISVYKKGFKQQEAEIPIHAILLGILLIVLFIFRKRIMELFKKREEEEELEYT